MDETRAVRSRWVPAAVFVTVATIVTQRPHQAMDIPAYFRDWFPYYIQKGNVPFEPIVPLWPVWGWRLIATAVVFWVLTIAPQAQPQRRASSPSLRSPDADQS
jgi:hypothetical protein